MQIPFDYRLGKRHAPHSYQGIEKLPPGIHRDWKERGLFVEVGQHAKSFKVQGSLYSPMGRKDIRITLGRHPADDLEQARSEAARLLQLIRAGKDPRVASPERALTVGGMFDENEARLTEQGADPEHIYNVRKCAERYFKADWWQLPVAEITPIMVNAKRREIAAKTPVMAKQLFRYFSAAYNHSRSLMPTLPPCPVPKQKRASDPESDPIPFAELPEWWQATATHPRGAMYRFGLLSGLRPGNLAAMRWDQITDRAVQFSADEMKASRPFDMPLSEAMLGVLNNTPRIGELVWFAYGPGRHPWRIKGGYLASRVGHRLRHTYSNVMVDMEIDPLIQVH